MKMEDMRDDVLVAVEYALVYAFKSGHHDEIERLGLRQLRCVVEDERASRANRRMEGQGE